VIAYFDTSALIPLVIEEPTSAAAATLWDAADRVTSVRMIYAEARAAVALAHRLGRLDAATRRRVVRDLDTLYEQLDRIDVNDDLARRAGVLAEEQRLRGYDAIHLAAAERVADPDTVFVAGDADLCQAAHAIQLHVTQLAGP
jgi:predicted nucleic acid-binding protein